MGWNTGWNMPSSMIVALTCACIPTTSPKCSSTRWSWAADDVGDDPGARPRRRCRAATKACRGSRACRKPGRQGKVMGTPR